MIDDDEARNIRTSVLLRFLDAKLGQMWWVLHRWAEMQGFPWLRGVIQHEEGEWKQ